MSADLNPTDVEFVLVRPVRVANVSAAARALANMGFERLTLVSPPAALDEDDADRSSAYGAWDILDRARRVSTLADAVAETSWVVGTSGRPSARAITPREVGVLAQGASNRGRIAIVFGPERTGLSRAELRLCHERVLIPTSARQPSLNLAQAVLVVAYELFVASIGGTTVRPPPSEPSPSVGDMESLLAQWRTALLTVGYLDERAPDRVLAELRRFLARSCPSPREVTLLRGIARQITWAGEEIARSRSARR